MRGMAELVVVILLFALGVVGGAKLKGDINIRRENVQLNSQLQQLSETAEALRNSAVQNALNYRAAIERLDAVAQSREADRETLHQLATQQRNALQKLERTRPDLRSQRAGADVLQHWNRSNQGPRTTSTISPAADSQPAAAAVPAAATGRQ